MNDVYHVGTASRSITPTVNGSTDYIEEFPPHSEQAGTFVRSFDQGVINIGNGSPDAHWVRDELRVRVMAIGPDSKGVSVVFLSSEIYLLFRNDLDAYHKELEKRVGSEVYQNLRVFIHAQHNHEGPDTAGLGLPVNHKYYGYMIEQMVDASVAALDAREPATLHFGQAPFYYGLGDNRDPRMEDNNVRVLLARAVSTHRVVGTMVQWGFHPETLLGYRPQFNQTNCTAIPLGSPECSAKGRFMTHDFPGWFSKQLRALQPAGSGEALYFNGAIGVQIGPNHVKVWDVDEQHPLGNGFQPPEGATLVGKSFYRTFLIGTGLANFTHAIKLSETPIPATPFLYREREFYTPMTNFFFKVGSCPARALNPFANPEHSLFLGNTLRKAYFCQQDVPPTNETCTFDNYAYKFDPVTKLPFRTATHLQTVTSSVQLGPLTFIALPGELAPELAVGLPQDFDERTDFYYQRPTIHATGAAYTLPGTVFSSIAPKINCAPQQPCWVFGLCNDELGYIFPISDWRLKCQTNETSCSIVASQGAFNYTVQGGSVAGQQCKKIVANQEYYQRAYTQQFSKLAWTVVNATCFYGQNLNDHPSGHYEESNSPSWDIAENLLTAVARMFGNDEPTGRYCQHQNCIGFENHNLPETET
mmetsp:Transcript_18331/g.27279  ORF Transcript_18331/g.27279 Transcript_18331/m.27279 type:complete len:644 (+) Transcript_18331:1941-3872(+)|eukprot:CAMPEP_0201546308 /NCGR_PEP_ID=MMETSP0173_2-20130828/2622_1 /ASSEMBLY_ACC=CAM_ASM_000268 /TAXON_ID=218659 /ORGANISM="Vexillifera sp., Strain DIVA3 564/2" /LENGTH=643 /DNA_ID=CAMNT_0047954935 /DNA_START=74 /DNA_END=2005 /DNA_ORIENTATION=-